MINRSNKKQKNREKRREKHTLRLKSSESCLSKVFLKSLRPRRKLRNFHFGKLSLQLMTRRDSQNGKRKLTENI